MADPRQPFRGVGMLGAGVLATVWSFGQHAAFFPDGYELAAAGSCFWGGAGLPALPCDALDLGYTTPLFPWLAGAMGMLLGRTQGVVALSLLCMSLLFVPLSTLVRPQGGLHALLALLVLLLSCHELQAWAVVPDERAMALLITAWAWVVFSKAQSKSAAVGAGLLAGLAGWARPEALAVAVLVPPALLLFNRSKAIHAALGAAVMVGLWMLCQRMLGGTWLPRPYEVAALELLTVLPDDWAKRLVGMGAWSPPVRAWGLIHGVAAPSGGMSPDPLAGVIWVGRALAVGTPTPLWGMAGVGAAHLLRCSSGRRTLTALLGMTLPWLLASTLMHARLDELPMANLLVMLLVLSALAAVGCAALVHALTGWLPSTRTNMVRGVLVVAISLMLGQQWPSSPIRPGVEFSPPGLAATQWLNEHPGDVVSSYESAPIVFRSNLGWREWPTPFEPERWEGVTWVVRSHLDVPEPMLLAPATQHLTEETGWAAGGQWVRIYRISSE